MPCEEVAARLETELPWQGKKDWRCVMPKDDKYNDQPSFRTDEQTAEIIPV